MLKIWLKHLFYEIAIDFLFDNLFNNFILPEVSRKEFLENYVDEMVTSHRCYIVKTGQIMAINPAIRSALKELRVLHEKKNRDSIEKELNYSKDN